MSNSLKITADMPDGQQLVVGIKMTNEHGTGLLEEEVYEGLLIGIAVLGKEIARHKLEAAGVVNPSEEEKKAALTEQLDYEPEAYVVEDDV